jgi:hypothetical protein
MILKICYNNELPRILLDKNIIIRGGFNVGYVSIPIYLYGIYDIFNSYLLIYITTRIYNKFNKEKIDFKFI